MEFVYLHSLRWLEVCTHPTLPDHDQPIILLLRPLFSDIISDADCLTLKQPRRLRPHRQGLHRQCRWRQHLGCVRWLLGKSSPCLPLNWPTGLVPRLLPFRGPDRDLTPHLPPGRRRWAEEGNRHSHWGREELWPQADDRGRPVQRFIHCWRALHHHPCWWAHHLRSFGTFPPPPRTSDTWSEEGRDADTSLL